MDVAIPSIYLAPHIVVLVHGNNGSAADFDAVESALLAKFGKRQMLIIKSCANEPDTSLGIEVGGSRLAKEVVETVFQYDLSPIVSCYKLSIIGHSLGGLYARYALFQIMNALSCLCIDYIDFVTICTPHLGSRRARSPSTVKNLLRLGVHKVLASRSMYGQTGVDLLVEANEQEQDGFTDAEQPSLSLLERMSDPESQFGRSLKRFKYGTLVAMTDGDVVVPYPSASIRNYNPYVSTFLTERYMQWQWYVHHSGFEEEDYASATFFERLNSKVNSSVQVNKHELGLDIDCAPRYSSIEGYDCDNKQEVEFPYDLLWNLQKILPWRRIDLTVEPCGMKGKLRLHDWPINKMQPLDCCADEFIDLLCEMIGADHQMRPLGQSSVGESSALQLVQRLKIDGKRTDENTDVNES